MFEERILEILQMIVFLFVEPSLVQNKVLEGLYGLGDAFNENKTSELHNSEILKEKKKKKKAS